MEILNTRNDELSKATRTLQYGMCKVIILCDTGHSTTALNNSFKI